MQPGALSKASEKTDQYKGKLQKLADEEAEHKTFLDQLGAAWEDLSLSLGGVATPIMGVIGLGGQVAGFGAQLNGTWNLLSKFKNIGGISGAVSSLGGIFGGLTGTLSGAGSALLGLATGPVGIIIAALIALGVAVYEVGKYFGWWTDLPSMFSAITSGVTALWNSFMSNEYVIQAIALIKQGLTDAWNAIVGFGQAIMTSIGGAGGEFDILGFAIQALQTILSVVGPVVVTYIQMMMNNFRAIYTVGQAVWPYLAAIVGGAINGIRGIISGAMAIWSGLQGAWRGLQSTASSVFGAINGVVSSAGGAWHNFQSTVSGVVNGIMDKINALKDAAAGITNLLTGGTSQGGIETVTTGAGSGGGYTNVSQGNTIIFNMYGDVRDEKTLDDMINAINSRLEFESLAKGTTNNGGVV